MFSGHFLISPSTKMHSNTTTELLHGYNDCLLDDEQVHFCGEVVPDSCHHGLLLMETDKHKQISHFFTFTPWHNVDENQAIHVFTPQNAFKLLTLLSNI